jgi:plasmid rolling circle replication initiator protein Rep
MALGKVLQISLNKTVMKYLPLTRKFLLKILIKNVETGEQLNR